MQEEIWVVEIEDEPVSFSEAVELFLNKKETNETAEEFITNYL